MASSVLFLNAIHRPFVLRPVYLLMMQHLFFLVRTNVQYVNLSFSPVRDCNKCLQRSAPNQGEIRRPCDLDEGMTKDFEYLCGRISCLPSRKGYSIWLLLSSTSKTSQSSDADFFFFQIVLSFLLPSSSTFRDPILIRNRLGVVVCAFGEISPRGCLSFYLIFSLSLSPSMFLSFSLDFLFVQIFAILNSSIHILSQLMVFFIFLFLFIGFSPSATNKKPEIKINKKNGIPERDVPFRNSPFCCQMRGFCYLKVRLASVVQKQSRLYQQEVRARSLLLVVVDMYSLEDGAFVRSGIAFSRELRPHLVFSFIYFGCRFNWVKLGWGEEEGKNLLLNSCLLHDAALA